MARLLSLLRDPPQFLPLPFVHQVGQFLKKDHGSLHVGEWNVKYFANAVQKSNDGMELEAYSLAVFCIASHCCGIGGAPLGKVLQECCFHLSDLPLNDHHSLPIRNMDLLQEFATKRFPYLSSLHAEWPDEMSAFPAFASMATFKRTRNAEQMDGKAYLLNQKEKLAISFESKYRSGVLSLQSLKDCLKRVPSEPWLHVITTTRLQKSYFTNVRNDNFESWVNTECSFKRSEAMILKLTEKDRENYKQSMVSSLLEHQS